MERRSKLSRLEPFFVSCMLGAFSVGACFRLEALRWINRRLWRSLSSPQQSWLSPCSFFFLLAQGDWTRRASERQDPSASQTGRRSILSQFEHVSSEQRVIGLRKS